MPEVNLSTQQNNSIINGNNRNGKFRAATMNSRTRMAANNERSGATNAASEFTNALKKLEAKGKIDLKGHDVEALATRLSELFSSRGINTGNLARSMANMLESAQGNSFANDFEKTSLAEQAANVARQTADASG